MRQVFQDCRNRFGRRQLLFLSQFGFRFICNTFVFFSFGFIFVDAALKWRPNIFSDFPSTSFNFQYRIVFFFQMRSSLVQTRVECRSNLVGIDPAVFCWLIVFFFLLFASVSGRFFVGIAPFARPAVGRLFLFLVLSDERTIKKRWTPYRY